MASITAGEVKFSEAMSCRVVFWRSTSRSSRSKTSVSRSVGQPMGLPFSRSDEATVAATGRSRAPSAVHGNRARLRAPGIRSGRRRRRVGRRSRPSGHSEADQRRGEALDLGGGALEDG